MKILYGIQGTGHGHVSRARELLPELSNYGTIDILLSGYNHNLDVEGNVVYRKRGLSLIYDQNGSVSIAETVRNLDLVRFITDVRQLSVSKYDLIISDFEPVTSWSAYQSSKPCVGISHQASFYSSKVPRPLRESVLAEKMLEKFAPPSGALGFHFRRYDDFIEPPLVRREVTELSPETGDYITVYLSSYDHQTLVALFEPITEIKWEIFSPYCDTPYTKGDHIMVHPIDNKRFLQSLATARGVISGAGFELCSEAMYLEKMLMVIPIANQYEQLCNATALAEMGISVVPRINGSFTDTVRYWVQNSSPVSLPEIADPAKIAERVVDHIHKIDTESVLYSPKQAGSLKSLF